MKKNKSKTLTDAEWSEINLAVKELNNDLRFQRFMDGVAGLKDIAVLDAAEDETLKNMMVTAAALGRVRAYLDLIDFVGARAPVETVEQAS